MEYKNIKTNETKTAFSFREDNEKIYIKFSANGKEYGYLKSNIEITTSKADNLPFRIYTYTKECYKCHKPTENVLFPCNFDRLLEHQNIVHICKIRALNTTD